MGRGGEGSSYLQSIHSTQSPGAKGQGAPLWTPICGAPALVWDGRASSHALGPASHREDNRASRREPRLWLTDAFHISGKEGAQPFTILGPASSLEPQGPACLPQPCAPQDPCQPSSPPPVNLLQLRLLLPRELLQLEPLAGPQLSQLSLDLPILLFGRRQLVGELLAEDLGQAAALSSQLLVHLRDMGTTGTV